MFAITPTHVWLGSGNRTGFQVLFDHSGDVEVRQMDVTWEEGGHTQTDIQHVKY